MPLAAWSKHSTDSVAQGYELMVTPLQLARAFCAYANGGRLPTVRLVKGVLDAEGNDVSQPAGARFNLAAGREPDAAARYAASWQMCLCGAPRRRLSGSSRERTTYEVPTWQVWNIFGKTGTAHISEGRAGYSGNRYNSTFIGAAPYENPKLVIALTLHEPDRSIAHYGGTVSAPGGAQILGRCLTYLQISPSPELAPPPAEIAAKLAQLPAQCVPQAHHSPSSCSSH